MADKPGSFVRAYNQALRNLRQASRDSGRSFQRMLDSLQGRNRQFFRDAYKDYVKTTRADRDSLNDTEREQRSRETNFNTYSKFHTEHLKSNLTRDHIGRSLVLYAYDAKHKDTLRYWDRLPLIVPLQPAKDGFLGMNFHYLPPQLRAHLLDTIYPSFGRNFDYNRLVKMSRSRLIFPCIKHYLYNHVRTKYLILPHDEWERVLFLPFERFDSRTGGPVDPSRIQAESIRKARRR
jgi:hypothetical protein